MYITEKSVVTEIPVNLLVEKFEKKEMAVMPVVTKIESLKIDDNDADYSYLESRYSYDEETNELFIHESCRYSQADIDEYGTEKVLEWLEGDMKHLKNLGNTWSYCGVRAKVTVKIPHVNAVGQVIFFEETMESAGLWGIEDDWSGESDSYIQEVFMEELFALQADCRQMNIDVTLIEQFLNKENNRLA